MGSKVKVKYAFCAHCRKEIENPTKRPMDSMEKTVWVIIIIASLGIGAIFYLIYNKYIRKLDTCPKCFSTLKFSADPFEKPKKTEVKTPKEKVMEKAGVEPPEKKHEEKEPEVEEKEGIFCPFCGEEL